MSNEAMRQALAAARDALQPYKTQFYRDEAIEIIDFALAEAEKVEPAQQEVPQAHAGGPEVVLTVEVEPDFMSRGHFYEGYKPYVDPTKVWSLSIGTQLITLQSHREAIEKLQTNGDAAVEIAANLLNQSAKKDAALDACVEALLACRYWSGQTTRPNQQFDGNAVAKALRKLLDIGAVPKNEQFRAELWIKDHAAITKAQEARKS